MMTGSAPVSAHIIRQEFVLSPRDGYRPVLECWECDAPIGTLRMVSIRCGQNTLGPLLFCYACYRDVYIPSTLSEFRSIETAEVLIVR
jgi:hypothetical protein